MDASPAPQGLRSFQAPKSSLGDLDAESAARLIAAAGDIALVIGSDGVVEDLAFGSEDLWREEYDSWLGRRWVETVTPESRHKIEALISDAVSDARPHWRQVNHPSTRGPDVPILYSAMNLRAGRIVAVGRDLRGIAVLQRKLVDAQAAMEREYSRLRHAETRYRLLFQIASEAVLIVDAASRKIVEANPAAGELLGKGIKDLIGRPVQALFTATHATAVEELLADARASGHAGEVRLALAVGEVEVGVAASLFRQDRGSHFLIRLGAPGLHAGVATQERARLLDVVERLPDALVVTDLDRRVLIANAAFVEMVQLGTEEQVRGEALERWLGRSGVDCNVLVASLREHGSVHNFATILRGDYGASEDVEVSAVAVPAGEQPCLGFAIRAVGRRLPSVFAAGRRLPQSVGQLTELVGRVPLKELVRETTDVIERLCIEAALELTGDNRASAAEMLGLSRQSFYAKLRRYGIGDLGEDDDGEG